MLHGSRQRGKSAAGGHRVLFDKQGEQDAAGSNDVRPVLKAEGGIIGVVDDAAAILQGMQARQCCC